jgi:2,3-bisphosphoglycerate-independent phosphoglycerate mutase
MDLEQCPVLMILIDGLGDGSHEGRTPLEDARTPNMDKLFGMFVVVVVALQFL